MTQTVLSLFGLQDKSWTGCDGKQMTVDRRSQAQRLHDSNSGDEDAECKDAECKDAECKDKDSNSGPSLERALQALRAMRREQNAMRAKIISNSPCGQHVSIQSQDPFY